MAMRALITGASGGIGSAIVDAFADDCDVIAHDLGYRDAEARPSVQRIEGDLSSEAGRAAVLAAVGREPLDFFLAGHGLGGTGALESLTPERVGKIMAVNYAALPQLIDALLPNLQAAAGSITIVASQAGLTGEGNHSAYCASKFAVVGWARAAAERIAAAGVRLRLMCPGCVDTEMLHGAMRNWAELHDLDYQQMLDGRVGQIPLCRLAAPAEIATGMRFLAELSTPRLVVLNQSGGETFNV
jgi:NAD(P)-dependent dehydrogenase (short-subunit alcohol dehydrogenase family)